MSIDIKVPAMGESVTEATVARWFKKEGDAVKRDEPLLELETDKVTVEVPAPADGAIESISVQAGATVQVGALLGAIAEGKAGKAAAPAAAASCRPSRRGAQDRSCPSRRRSLPHRHRKPMHPQCRRPAASPKKAGIPPPPSPAPARMAASPRATCWARSKPRAAKRRRAGAARRPARAPMPPARNAWR